MRTRRHLGAIVLGMLGAAGCASWGVANAKHDCGDNNDCGVTVVVNASGAACTIDDPGDIQVKKNKKPHLVWTIQNNGGGHFKFVAGGIQFNDKSDPVPSGEFEDKGPEANGTKYRVRDHNKVPKQNPADPPKRYNYKITVVKPDGSPGCERDPTVLNDGCDDGSC
jgi:hypothetical protein